MVLVEAMAAGLPIVTTDAPGVCDVIDDQVNGLKVESDNPVQIAEAAASVLSDKDKAELLSGNALKTAEEKYDWPVVTAAYAEFYNEILNKTDSR
jgi:glycosyltransferase involved in cell wall biosynthesis